MQLMRAERECRAGEHGRIAERCAEAIARCEPLLRATEPVWARCLLGLSALAQGRNSEAGKCWSEIEPALAANSGLPSRIRRLAGELAEGLGVETAPSA
jgi:hypothetical protein